MDKLKKFTRKHSDSIFMPLLTISGLLWVAGMSLLIVEMVTIGFCLLTLGIAGMISTLYLPPSRKLSENGE